MGERIGWFVISLCRNWHKKESYRSFKGLVRRFNCMQFIVVALSNEGIKQ